MDLLSLTLTVLSLIIYTTFLPHSLSRPPSPPRHVRPHPKLVSPRQPPPHWTEVGVVVRNLSVAPPTERVPLVEGRSRLYPF